MIRVFSVTDSWPAAEATALTQLWGGKGASSPGFLCTANCGGPSPLWLGTEEAKAWVIAGRPSHSVCQVSDVVS